MITVCKDCPKRHPGCHGDCEWYKAERKALDMENMRKRAENAALDSVSGKWNYDHRGVKRK
ncbi:hypothetical protein MKD05_15485 [[Clostridium] innocuum]|nr:hypothetical protein [[Clostridium] innocuum]MCR0612584.1 hypothetical protein [[Clostridium] innocuum]